MGLEKLSKTLNIEHDLEQPKFPVVKADPVKEMTIQQQQKQYVDLKDADEDYATVREELQTTVRRVSRAIEQMTAIAEETNEPRAYEVLGQLIKTQVATTSRLYTMHKDALDLRRNNAQAPERHTQNDNSTINIDNAVVFKGTGSDLISSIVEIQREMDKAKKKE